MFFKEFLDKTHVKYSENVSTAEISSIRAGGEAKFLISPRSEAELSAVIKAAIEFAVPYKIIGNCTNTMFSDKGFEGAIISTRCMSLCNLTAYGIEVSAGMSFSRLSRMLTESGIYVSNAMSGIPGSVGGMVVGNAGAYGECCSDVFISCKALDINSGRVISLTKHDMNFSYRYSALKETKMPILSVTFEKKYMNRASIHEELISFSAKRREKQPKEPSLGSFFKRPEGAYASELIDKCALRGYSYGRAAVSQKHAGFIVNLGGATAWDIIALSEIVKETVDKRFGIHLENEVELVI